MSVIAVCIYCHQLWQITEPVFVQTDVELFHIKLILCDTAFLHTCDLVYYAALCEQRLTGGAVHKIFNDFKRHHRQIYCTFLINSFSYFTVLLWILCAWIFWVFKSMNLVSTYIVYRSTWRYCIVLALPELPRLACQMIFAGKYMRAY